MLKETPKSLRLFFGFVAIVSLLSGVAGFAQAEKAPVILLFALINLSMGGLFGYIVAKFEILLRQRPQFIKAVLIANFVLSIIIFCLTLLGGLFPSALFRFVVAVLVFLYLMRSVTRLSSELNTPAGGN